MPPALADELKARAITLGTSILKTQSQWYSAGTWENPWGQQWVYTSSGPSALCASMYRATGTAAYLATCQESFDFAITNLQGPGYFVDVASSATALERYVFATHLAWSMYVLGPNLPTAYRTRWFAALKANVEAVEASGDLIWFENGNWVANKVRMLYLTMLVCQQQGDSVGYARYQILYERTYVLLTTPWLVPTVTSPSGDPKWNGYGVITDTAGSWADWSDTVAHIVEVNGGPPMPNSGAGTSWNGSAPFSTYDGDYSALTIEHLASWFVASRDYRALKLLNGVTNKYMSTVNTTTWVGDFSGGSRHNNPANGIYTPSLAVLSLLGSRQSGTTNYTEAKVLSEWDSSVASVMAQYPLGNLPFAIARSWLNVIGTILYAAEVAQLKL